MKRRTRERAKKPKAPAKKQRGSRRAKEPELPNVDDFVTEIAELDSLRPHPNNYKGHPEKQLVHIGESLLQHGPYKNVVVARDGTILAGHGVVEGARKIGLTRFPVRRLDIDPDSPAALKIVAGDNEIAKLATDDNRALMEILRRIKAEDERGLAGTGFDDDLLSAYDLLSGVAEKGVNDVDSEWTGMPECESDDQTAWGSVKVNFASKEDMEKFSALVGQTVIESTRSIWYPKAEIGHFADKAYDRDDEGDDGEGELDSSP